MGTSISSAASARSRDRALPSSTITLLHDTVAKYERSASTSSGGQPSAEGELALCTTLEQLCRDAHKAGLGPETVVVALKQAYRTVPPQRGAGGEPVKTHYRDVFVKCVRRYFLES